MSSVKAADCVAIVIEMVKEHHEEKEHHDERQGCPLVSGHFVSLRHML